MGSTNICVCLYRWIAARWGSRQLGRARIASRSPGGRLGVETAKHHVVQREIRLLLGLMLLSRSPARKEGVDNTVGARPITPP